MRHDPGLDASPPVRYILEVERSGYSTFHLPFAVDGQPPREAAALHPHQQGRSERRRERRHSHGVRQTHARYRARWRRHHDKNLISYNGTLPAELVPSSFRCRGHFTTRGAGENGRMCCEGSCRAAPRRRPEQFSRILTARRVVRMVSGRPSAKLGSSVLQSRSYIPRNSSPIHRLVLSSNDASAKHGPAAGLPNRREDT